MKIAISIPMRIYEEIIAAQYNRAAKVVPRNDRIDHGTLNATLFYVMRERLRNIYIDFR